MINKLLFKNYINIMVFTKALKRDEQFIVETDS